MSQPRQPWQNPTVNKCLWRSTVLESTRKRGRTIAGHFVFGSLGIFKASAAGMATAVNLFCPTTDFRKYHNELPSKTRDRSCYEIWHDMHARWVGQLHIQKRGLTGGVPFLQGCS